MQNDIMKRACDKAQAGHPFHRMNKVQKQTDMEKCRIFVSLYKPNDNWLPDEMYVSITLSKCRQCILQWKYTEGLKNNKPEYLSLLEGTEPHLLAKGEASVQKNR